MNSCVSRKKITTPCFSFRVKEYGGIYSIDVYDPDSKLHTFINACIVMDRNFEV